MHKIFAKTLFLGKNLVFLPHCHSTNEEAKRLSRSRHFPEGSIVWTDYQEKGRGQQGNVWLSEPGKNLLFTIFLKPDGLLPADQFRLTMIFSVAACEVLQELIPSSKVQIKWPNDIYCDDSKIAGFLIETSISGGKVEMVYCGMGLNVNQEHFTLPTATSMKLASGQNWDREQVLEKFLIQSEKYLESVKLPSEKIKQAYLSKLRWLNEAHLFKVKGEDLEGTITGVAPSGKLLVDFGNDRQTFDVKEIEFVR